MPKILLANPNSRALVPRLDDVPADALAGYDAAAHRLLWTVERGDIVVLPRPVSQEFVGYMARTLGLEVSDFHILNLSDYGVTAWDPAEIEALVVEVRSMVLANTERDWRISCFVRDRDVARWGRLLGIYGLADDVFAQNVAQLVNTKSVFRALAASSHIPVADGYVVDRGSELIDAMAELIHQTGSVIVKQDQNVSGVGNSVFSVDPNVVPRGAYNSFHLSDVSRESAQIGAAQAGLDEEVELGRGASTSKLVVEVYHPGSTTISSEFLIPLSGEPVMLNYGEMRMKPRLEGYIVPPQDLPDSSHGLFCTYSQQIAVLARSIGYHGPINIDAIVTRHGEVLFNEFNGRAGAATHIDSVCRRLLGSAYMDTHVVVTSLSTHALEFVSLVSRLEAEGVHYDPIRGSGVLIGMDNTADRGIIEYIAIGHDEEEALAFGETVTEMCAVLAAV